MNEDAFCKTCGHLKEVHGTDCKGFKFVDKGFRYCHCEKFLK